MKADFTGVVAGHGKPEQEKPKAAPLPPSASEDMAAIATKTEATVSRVGLSVVPQQAAIQGCPFVPAATRKPRVKMFAYGPAGSGKTTVALQFPGAVVIDADGGSRPYANRYPFSVLPEEETRTVEGIERSIDWLMQNRHPFTTLVIDPITLLWDMWQRHWSDIYRSRKQDTKYYKHEYYDLQPKDWMPIKSHWKSFIRKLLQLDMNVVCTAREKELYAEGAMMKKIGVTFDGQRDLPYEFDLVLHFDVTPDGRHVATVKKDRWRFLQADAGVIASDFAVISQAFGPDTLSRSAEPVRLVTQVQAAEIRRLFSAAGHSAETVRRGLARYGAEAVEDLRDEDAQKIIANLSKAALASSDVGSTTETGSGTTKKSEQRAA